MPWWAKASGTNTAYKPTKQTLIWTVKTVLIDEKEVQRLSFEGAVHSGIYAHNAALLVNGGENQQGQLQLTACTYADLTEKELSLIDTLEIGSTPKVKIQQGRAREVLLTDALILPFRKHNGKFQKMVNLGYYWYASKNATTPSPLRISSNQTWAANSVLATGNWYKLAITQTAAYKLDANFFRNTLGIDPASIDPRNIQLYGHGGSMMPGPNATNRPEDLPQNRIMVSGELDGTFDNDDYVVFYGKGPHDVVVDIANRQLTHRQNFYSDTAYYYLTVGSTPGLRVGAPTVVPPAVATVNTTADLQWIDQDRFNLLKSGREWYGDNYDFVLNRSYSFNDNLLVPQQNVRVRIATLATGLRSGHRSTFAVTFGGASLGTITHLHNSPFPLATLGYNATTAFTASYTGGPLNIGMTYNKAGFNEAVGYLNWIEVMTQRRLSTANGWQLVHSFEALNQGVTAFQVTDVTDQLHAWDVTNPWDVRSLPVTGLGTTTQTFSDITADVNPYLIFSATNLPTPNYVGRQVNQNLHGLATPDLVIIAPFAFMAQATRLADARRTKDGLDVQIVSPTQIYAEYSSGKQDLVAIRDFLRSLYWKTPGKLKYVLLFGDASYDYKNRISGNTNWVPIFESVNSLNPINSYSSDDYIGFMDDAEGEWREWQSDRIDLGIGRLVVKNQTEATQVVDKLLGYANSFDNLGAWRTRMSVVSDNGDGLLHLSDAEAVVAPFESSYADFNVNKVHVAAYPTVPSPLGSVSPAARDALDRSVNQGSLMVNYAGHGNEFQWTSEQILTIDNIFRNWQNTNTLPMFVTATCDFGRYDDPSLVSGGELMLLLPRSGGSAVVTTTRPVYANNNRTLNLALTNATFTKVNGEYRRLGDVMRICKNGSVVQVPIGFDDPGNRSFALLGDPSMRLAFPEHTVKVTSITDSAGRPTSAIRALDKLTLKGKVVDKTGVIMDGFNGEVICTIYDKPSRVTVREGSLERTFSTRNSIVYSGRATVSAGNFTITFVTPLDINYLEGNGKVSFYAMDYENLTDAAGNDMTLRIGGSNEDAKEDDNPPLLRLYMNDTTFVNGGLTPANSRLLARISDDNGINLATSGIGHEMILRIDNDPNQEYVVNEFYQADPNTFRSGTLSFPLIGLKPGLHTARLVVWDTHNNSATGNLEFRVADDAGSVVVENFGVYPNPVVNDQSVYFTFGHNKGGGSLDTQIDIYDLTGKLIRKLNWTSTDANSRMGAERELSWDLTTKDGQQVSNGMYIARLNVTTGANSAKASFKIVVSR